MDYDEDSLDSAERDTLMLKLYTGAIYDDPEYIQLNQSPPHQSPPNKQQQETLQLPNTHKMDSEPQEEVRGEEVNRSGAGRRNFSDSNLEGTEEQKDKGEWKKPFNFLENDRWKAKQDLPQKTNYQRRPREWGRGWKEEEGFCTSCCSLQHISEDCPLEGPMRSLPEVVLTVKAGACLNCVNCGGLDHLLQDCKEEKMDKLEGLFYARGFNLKRIIDKFQRDYPRNADFPVLPRNKPPFTRFRRTLSAPIFRKNYNDANEGQLNYQNQNSKPKKRKKGKSKDKEETNERHPKRRKVLDEETQKYVAQRRKEKKKEKRKFLKAQRKQHPQ
eukprot:TRINITY_DN1069_c0_g1_i1.p1 TRINITY_DN1069_c0_g1~~TRINITY_DN1069_c0_g1_i1.p1  ORF type:complete len:339 (-),score=104.98 TRINITY_DN1069_c0_g1_i1:16-1002(-)